LQGLIKLDPQGNVLLLSARVSDDSPLDPGTLITYANDLDISSDGTVYFTDRSVKSFLFSGSSLGSIEL